MNKNIKLIKIMDKYLIIEFIKPFLLTLLGLTIIMLSSYLFQLTDFIIIKDVPVKVVLKLLLYKLPQILVQSFSMAVLFATLLSLSSLVKDGEFVALRMAGIDFSRMVISLIVVALLISSITYWMNERIVPWANKKYRDTIIYSIKKEKPPEVHENLLFKDVGERYFCIGEINDKTNNLKQIIIYNRSNNTFITAVRGKLKEDAILLQEGLIYTLNKDGYNQKEEKVRGLELKITRDISEIYKEEKKISTMNRKELKTRIKLFKFSGIETTKLTVEYHFRLAQTLACVIFVLIGAPLSIKSNKGRIFGVIASVVIIFIYYVFLSISRSLGRNGLLPAILAAWLSNLLFVLVGSFLIFKEDYFKLK